MADWFQVPAVSTANSKKMWEAESAPYFTILFAAALLLLLLLLLLFIYLFIYLKSATEGPEGHLCVVVVVSEHSSSQLTCPC